jgi:hypothetical protein
MSELPTSGARAVPFDRTTAMQEPERVFEPTTDAALLVQGGPCRRHPD